MSSSENGRSKWLITNRLETMKNYIESEMSSNYFVFKILFLNDFFKYDCLNCLQANLSQVQGKTLTDKLQNSCVLLQTHVNCCYDADMDRLSTEQRNGIKQVWIGSGSISAHQI